MKASHRCPKCQGSKLLVTHLRIEAWTSAGAGTLAARDRWYEEWGCVRCGFVERYRLAAMPDAPQLDLSVETPGGEAPYR